MSYTDWCEDCQEITPLTDDGVSGKACAECGHQNTLQTEAAQYATTVTYAGGEFTLDDEALAAFRGPPEDKPEAKWLVSFYSGVADGRTTSDADSMAWPKMSSTIIAPL